MKKILVIGSGNVGIAYVNNLISQKSLVDEIVLIDTDREKAVGEAMDLSHAKVVIDSNVKIKAGSYKDAFGADIVVICAGIKQQKEESRLDLINKNKEIIEEIVKNVVSNGFDGVFIVATNPVDIMTYYVKTVSNFPAQRVIGTGTMLDTMRLKYLLSQKINVSTKNVNTYVVGEHGDSSFILWSKSTIGMVPISETISKDDLESLEYEVRRLGYKIIDYKGYTSEGIAMCLLLITMAILNDENLVLSVSSPVDGIYIGMPSVIGKDGIKGTMKIDFNEEEKILFENSKKVIKEAIDSLEE